jgi:hypothetical protein
MLPGALLGAQRLIARLFGARTLWWGVSDTHAHYVVEATPVEVGRVRRDFDFVLAGLGDDEFQPSRARPIVEQGHLEACWNYVVANREKHGQPGDPVLDPGSGLVDVLGARQLPGFSRNTWQKHLPRRDVRWLLDRLGVRHDVLRPPSDAEIRTLGAGFLVAAAAAAIGWPSLDRNVREMVAARTAVMQMGLKALISRSELVAALEIARPASYAMQRGDAEELVDVVRRQIAFRLGIRGPAVARREFRRTVAAG